MKCQHHYVSGQAEQYASVLRRHDGHKRVQACIPILFVANKWGQWGMFKWDKMQKKTLLLLLQLTQTFFRLPGGRLRPGEDGECYKLSLSLS